jgi:hypothetical protein
MKVTVGASSIAILMTSCFQNSKNNQNSNDNCDSQSGSGSSGSGSSGSKSGSGYSDEYKGFTIAIQDDYSYWHAHNESDESGKLLLINTDDNDENEYDNGDNYNNNNNHDNDNNNDDNNNNNNKNNNNNDSNNVISSNENNSNRKDGYCDNNANNNTDIIQIFFDDNIERNRAHIVDVRDIKTFKHIPFNKTKDVFIKKIEPYYAIIDENYYVNLVEEMVENQLKYSK